MLPTYTALFEAHRWLCRNRRIQHTERELHDAQIAIAKARLLAVALAQGIEEDEPAALMLALLLEAEALGDACDAFPIVAVRHLLKVSLRLDLVLELADRIELRAIRTRALPHRHALELLRAPLDTLRALISARVRPLP